MVETPTLTTLTDGGLEFLRLFELLSRCLRDHNVSNVSIFYCAGLEIYVTAFRAPT